MNPTQKSGVLLINLGTPDAPTTPALRTYLREFLSDIRVITLPGLLRWLLVNLIIVPFRSAKSAKLYKTIWSERGSPLRFHTEDVATKLSQELGHATVKVGMRYGNPSIAKALQEFDTENITRIHVIAMFPQYSTAAWGSAVAKVYQEAAKSWNSPSLSVIPPFFDHPKYIDALADISRPYLDQYDHDFVLMSFHGIPQSHITRSAPDSTICQKAKDCCAKMSDQNVFCYRAQSYATARALAAKLQLPDGKVAVTFQSRLGKAPWIQPFTDEVLINLAQHGHKRIAILCPSFTADCLETLEEIAVQNNELFKEHGGDEVRLVPCLNSETAWISALQSMVEEDGFIKNLPRS